MVLFNYSTRELTAKIVYYGPGLCGKTTNLQYIHSTLPDNVKGKMLSLATKTDRTLFFDFLPIDLGNIRGMKTRVQLYTVPGQVFYNETRKLVLKGADGIVFVADSQTTMLGANVESFKNLEDNLRAHGMNLSEMPHVLQFNKRDLPKLSSIEELNAAINRFNAPFYESVATTGIGVQDTLKAITKLVLLHLTRKYDPKATAAASVQATPPAVSVGSPARRDPAAAKPLKPAATPPRPSRGAVPSPSPAQTMQMPVAKLSPGAIPLSDSVLDPGAGETAGGGAVDDFSFDAPSIDRPEPTSFADDEIQNLVDEVQESEMGSEPAAPDRQVVENPWDESAPRSAASGPEHGVAESRSPGAAEPSSAPSFEIDHGVDPDWAPEGPNMASAATPSWDLPSDEAAAPASSAEAGSGDDAGEVWDLGSADEESAAHDDYPVAEPSVEATPPRPAPSGLPRLTEVVDGKALFDDPAIDVARMVAGEEREIVIPLEVEEVDRSVQRFKLSIRLRMDPID